MASQNAQEVLQALEQEMSDKEYPNSRQYARGLVEALVRVLFGAPADEPKNEAKSADGKVK